MPAVSFTRMRTALGKGDIQPVYYLTGEEEVLKDEFVQLLVEHASDPSTRDFNLDTRTAADLDAESLNNLVETPPMLAERRIAIVRNLEQWRKNSKVWKTLYAYVERPSPATTLVLIHGPGQEPDTTIARNAVHVKAAFADADEMRNWASARAEAMGLAIDPDALDHLLVVTDYNLALLSSELQKLNAVAHDGPFGVEDVGNLVGVRRGETTGDWIDAALEREVARSVDLTDVVLQQPGITGVRLVMNLGTALIGTRIARAHLDEGQSKSRVPATLIDMMRAHREIRVGRYGDEAARWSKAATRWSAGELDQAIASAHQADLNLKSTTLSDERGTIVTMLLSFSSPGVRA